MTSIASPDIYLHKQPEPIPPGQDPTQVPEIDPERPVPVPPDQTPPEPVEDPIVPEPAPPVEDPNPNLPDHIITRATAAATGYMRYLTSSRLSMVAFG